MVLKALMASFVLKACMIYFVLFRIPHPQMRSRRSSFWCFKLRWVIVSEDSCSFSFSLWAQAQRRALQTSTSKSSTVRVMLSGFELNFLCISMFYSKKSKYGDETGLLWQKNSFRIESRDIVFMLWLFLVKTYYNAFV